MELSIRKLTKSQSVAWATTLGLVALMHGCDKADSNNPLGDLCCEDFSVGADLGSVDFGVDAEIAAEYKAFAQAASDMSATATAALNDITTACRNIAVDLGADAQDTELKGLSGRAAATGWCAEAKAQIEANAALEAAGTLTVEFAPPACRASLDAQANCEASCQVDANCTPGELSVRCEGGKLSGQCEASCTGSCEGSVTAAAKCEGTCNAECQGSCTAQGGVSVECKGVCDANCTGTCNGSTVTGAACNGTCEGECSGTCKVEAGADIQCNGKCEGKCTGSCELEASADFKCDAECKGECSVEFKAPKCEGEIMPPSCEVKGDCKANCEASIKAKAECTPPELTITASAEVDASLQVQYEAAIHSLKANLPNIIVVLKGRGQAFIDSAEAMVSGGLELTAQTDLLGVEGVACGVTIGLAAGDAVDNATTAISAATTVTGAVGIN